MGLTATTAAWLLAASSLAGTATQAVTSAIANRQQRKAADEQEKTVLAQTQAKTEQAPELLAQAGNNKAVKKNTNSSFGLQESIIHNSNMQTNAPIANKEYYG